MCVTAMRVYVCQKCVCVQAGYNLIIIVTATTPMEMLPCVHRVVHSCKGVYHVACGSCV